MHISSRGRYALRIMLDIAMHQDHGPVTMKEVAKRQHISKKYGDQIGMQLSQSGILLASRGRQGGYRLVSDPEQLNVLQILKVMEGSMAPVQCLETPQNLCERCDFCITLPMWMGLNKVVSDYLGAITLQDLLAKARPQPELEDLPVPE